MSRPATEAIQHALTPADDDFHEGDAPWFTEGSWWGLQLPSHDIGCWIYHQTRRNLGIASGGIWVWDAGRSSCFEIPYYNNRQLQLLGPGPHDLNDFTWPDGVRLRTLEPLRRYRLTFDDPGRLSFDLTFSALIEPAILAGGQPPRPHRLGERRLLPDGARLRPDGVLLCHPRRREALRRHRRTGRAAQSG